MDTMSTASRTACTSCGVRLTLPRGIGFLSSRTIETETIYSLDTLRAAKGDHRRAVPTLVGSAGADLGDSPVPTQALADGLAQAPRAVAVDHPHLFARGEEGAVDVGFELLQRRLHPHADQF